MAWVKPPPPVPITAAMVAPANPYAGYPRYDQAGDWYMGVTGNGVDVSLPSLAKAGRASATDTVATAPVTRAQKTAAIPGMGAILGDLGKDYGIYANQTGRTGPVLHYAAYPDKTSPPILTSVVPANGPNAGGTAITLSGAGFTGATGVAMGGTACTSVVVVNSNTITAVTPAKTNGLYSVIVTTPNGSNPTGLMFSYP
jgi:hypothetical protein